MLILAIVIGVALAFCFSLAFTMGWVKASNDLGDSKAKYSNFSEQPMNFISKNK